VIEWALLLFVLGGRERIPYPDDQNQDWEDLLHPFHSSIILRKSRNR